MDPIPNAANRAERVSNARFAALYDLHSDRVFRLSLRLCGGCHAEAEDVAQEALIEAFRAFPRFAGRARVTTWLYTITVRTWRRHRASQEPETLGFHDEDAERLLISPIDAIGSRLTHLTIEAAIAALPGPLREAFVLVKSEGLMHREAAAILDLPLGTVQARVHDAARRLRAALSDDFPAAVTPPKGEKVGATL